MPTLPLDHYPTPRTAIANIILRPEMDDNGNLLAEPFIGEAMREMARSMPGKDPAVLDPEIFDRLMMSGPPEDDEEKRWQDVNAMGVFYISLIQLIHYRPELATWNNAMKLVRELRKGTSLPASKRYLINVRNKYLCVAHLIAARLLRNHFANIDDKFDVDDAFICFLMDAENIRLVVERFQPKRANSEPFSADDPWILPADTPWPIPKDVWPDLNRIAIPSLPDNVDTILRSAGRPRKH